MESEKFSPSLACAGFTARVRYEDLPADVVDVIKRDFLDWVGCCIGGAADPSSQPIKKLADTLGGNAQATALGCAAKRTAPMAAMCNAYFSHILEMDDVDRESISHPASINFPPALALSELTGKTGRDLILAAVCGFETMLRVGTAITPAHYKVFHTTATAGVFGAAMAAGKMLGLEEKQLSWALGNAGTQSAGLWQFLPDGAMSKFLHTGSAAANGVTEALLAQYGFSGPAHVLEGKQGFFAGYARQDVNMDLFKDFGKKWRSGTISFKPYPCCRHTHSAIDAGLEIRRLAKGRALRSIKLFTYNTAATIAGTRAPVTGRQGKFSVAWCAASAICRGLPSEASFSQSALAEQKVRDLESRIELIVDEKINACVPRNWPCRIEAVAEDGEELVAQIQNPTGDPENALDWEGVETKFRVLTDGLISPAAQDEIIALCKKLETVERPGVILETANASFKTRY